MLATGLPVLVPSLSTKGSKMEFKEILQDHRIQFRTEGHHHTRPGWINFDCPYCGKGSRKWHMGYNTQFGYVTCWRCGRHNVFDVLIELTGMERSEVGSALRGLELSNAPTKAQNRGTLAIPACVGSLTGPHRKYLEKRGFDSDRIAKLWGLGGIGANGGRFGLAWRLFIPIHYHGEIVSWTTRSLSDTSDKKYRTARENEESMSHKTLLYGEDYCKQTAIVFEGCPDVWAVGPGAVATLGTIWSVAQLKALLKFPRRVVCFDNEEVAQRRAVALCQKLAMADEYETVNLVVSRKGRDLSTKGIDELRRWL